MKASYGGHSTPSRAPVLLGIMAIATAGHMAIYDWGDFKVSKMLPAYPSEPRTVDQQKQFHNSHLESQLAKARQRITELSVQDIPEDRETAKEEKARWQEQKEHLLARIAELEEEIRIITKAYSEPIADEDRELVARLAEGGES